MTLNLPRIVKYMQLTVSYLFVPYRNLSPFSLSVSQRPIYQLIGIHLFSCRSAAHLYHVLKRMITNYTEGLDGVIQMSVVS